MIRAHVELVGASILGAAATLKISHNFICQLAQFIVASKFVADIG
jgi:hypothetical protein